MISGGPFTEGPQYVENVAVRVSKDPHHRLFTTPRFIHCPRSQQSAASPPHPQPNMRRATRRTARRALASAALAALAGTASADYAYPDPANAFPGYSLVVDEGFNTLNYTLFTPDWDCSGWGNGMRAAYTTSPKNLFIKDGVLNLNPVCGRLQPDKSICTPFSGYPECACEPTNYIPIDATAGE